MHSWLPTAPFPLSSCPVSPMSGFVLLVCECGKPLCSTQHRPRSFLRMVLELSYRSLVEVRREVCAYRIFFAHHDYIDIHCHVDGILKNLQEKSSGRMILSFKFRQSHFSFIELDVWLSDNFGPTDRPH